MYRGIRDEIEELSVGEEHRLSALHFDIPRLRGHRDVSEVKAKDRSTMCVVIEWRREREAVIMSIWLFVTFLYFFNTKNPNSKD